MSHRTTYRFYIRKFPQGTTQFSEQDIELLFGCDYMNFSNLIPNGDIQNIYTENFIEKSGVGKIFIPQKSDLTHKEYECKLKLFFRGGDVQSRFNSLCDYILGQKLQWHDTFRNKYAVLLATKAPTIAQERLYGDDQFMVVEITFTNLLGKTFTESQIN